MMNALFHWAKTQEISQKRVWFIPSQGNINKDNEKSNIKHINDYINEIREYTQEFNIKN